MSTEGEKAYFLPCTRGVPADAYLLTRGRSWHHMHTSVRAPQRNGFLLVYSMPCTQSGNQGALERIDRRTSTRR